VLGFYPLFYDQLDFENLSKNLVPKKRGFKGYGLWIKGFSKRGFSQREKNFFASKP